MPVSDSEIVAGASVRHSETGKDVVITGDKIMSSGGSLCVVRDTNGYSFVPEGDIRDLYEPTPETTDAPPTDTPSDPAAPENPTS